MKNTGNQETGRLSLSKAVVRISFERMNGGVGRQTLGATDR